MAKKGRTTVRMKIKVTGFRDGQEWPDRGDTITLPDAEAELLLEQGKAVPEDQEVTEDAPERRPRRQDAPTGDSAEGAEASQGDSVASTGDEPEGPVKPAKNAKRDQWEAYAAAVGVDLEGVSNKGDIIDRVEAAGY